MAANTKSTLNHDEKVLYQELHDFLLSPRSDVRKEATEAVLQVLLAPDNEGSFQLLFQSDILKALAKNIQYTDDRTVAVQALQGLVLSTSHERAGPQAILDLLLEASGLSRLLEVLLSSPPQDDSLRAWRQQINLGCALLANLTREERGAVELVGQTLPDEAVMEEPNQEESTVKPTMELLLSRFLQEAYRRIPKTANDEKYKYGSKQDDEDPLDPYQHFAAVLMNCTQVNNGQRFLFRIHHKTDSSSVLQKLLPQLKSPNWIRRRGVAGICRNCCLDKDSSFWLLNTVKITKHLLYPLAGPEELDVDEKQGLDPDLWLEGPDKVREPDAQTRLYLVESILLLCGTSRANRNQLRLERAYVILKWADMVEEDERINEQIYECVNYLRADEEGTAEGSSDLSVQKAYRKLSAATSSAMTNTSIDYDAVD